MSAKIYRLLEKLSKFDDEDMRTASVYIASIESLKRSGYIKPASNPAIDTPPAPVWRNPNPNPIREYKPRGIRLSDLQ